MEKAVRAASISALSCSIFIWCEIKLLKVQEYIFQSVKKKEERKREILEICTWKSEPLDKSFSA